MAVNRYAASCAVCGARVAPMAGNLTKKGGGWVVTHLPCEGGWVEVKDRHGVHDRYVSDGVDVYNIGGNEYIRNKAGRCEDAPCCGCCTI